ncbi:DRTGG domain-containing protein [Halobacteroides halobius DSM 5150]|uniref:DRTGG domain-containing protein n=1 Tax=Halobacteroides halobius (strain ATCC 35273 / DSM 5150 / MD-1) TaxID=748449 RepID=L0KBK0_HALHC|nr:DRTGG domain-containing protein [Halobacteroides halobius]AGB41915.1 DRTGG domain-containing protein [Halobacteroides halobius DSM 5150]
MKLKEVQDLLSAKIIYIKDESALKKCIISTACGADLMSDVLAFTKEKTLLLTGLTNPQVVRTAEMIDLAAIIFVRGKEPLSETIDLAKSKQIPLLVTDKPLYEACGLLYSAGLAAEKLTKLQ